MLLGEIKMVGGKTGSLGMGFQPYGGDRLIFFVYSAEPALGLALGLSPSGVFPVSAK